ncbi:hypothetical protein, partial [Acinetobacter baumannii]|uniref:hypothetical protein n=1 Tax=Acinetobacter baumannii TaxID=470 RepID=UPI0037D2DE1F
GKEYSINGLYKQFEKQLAPTSQHLPEQNFLPEHSITDTLLHTHTSETNTPHHLTKKRKKKKQKL